MFECVFVGGNEPSGTAGKTVFEYSAYFIVEFGYITGFDPLAIRRVSDQQTFV